MSGLNIRLMLRTRSKERNDADREPVPPPGGQVLERAEAVGDPNDRGVGTWRQRHRALDEGGHRPPLNRVGDEPVTIVTLAGKGDEEGAGHRTPGVDDGEAEGPNGGRGLQPAAGGGQQVVDADGRRHAVSCGFRRRVYQPHGWATPGADRSGGMPK